MPIEIKDVDGGRGNVITASGFLRDEEYIETLKRHLSQDKEKFKKYRYSLADYRAVTEVEISTPAIQLVASLCKAAAFVNPDVVVAVVAESDLKFGLSRMWEMLCEGIPWETSVFKSYEDAEKWIAERVKDKWNIVDPTIGDA